MRLGRKIALLLSFAFHFYATIYLPKDIIVTTYAAFMTVASAVCLYAEHVIDVFSREG